MGGMTYWVTSDTHLGHARIAKLTGRPADFRQRILNGLRILQSGDILIHLGDVSWNDEEEYAFHMSVPAGVRKWLVRGNHDKSSAWHMRNGWDAVVKEMKLQRFGMVISFSHKPTPEYNCDIQLHGHFHNANPDRWEGDLKSYLNSRHRLYILEENGYKPVTLRYAIDYLPRTQEMI